METPTGRRVLVAVTRGRPGALIQAWREKYDPKHAARLPPHLTLCYRPPDAPLEALAAQVRHAFPDAIPVRLGEVFVLPHREAPMAVRVLETEALDDARRRLFDRTHAAMGGRDDWPWHITCVRYGHSRDRDALLAAAAQELALDDPWTISAVSYLELRGSRYEALAEWSLEE
ncbi:MAG: 2'-5' RNA ligase family protein [Chloroflexi bacterium]|nr:2'-5' RNA ligase family protein [Chloroflexota bacterium]